MIPILFELGPIKIYSYGLMLGIGFLLGSYILSLELKRKKLDPNMASTITILAVVFGISGFFLAHLAGSTLFAGLSTLVPDFDAVREWTARAGGWFRGSDSTASRREPH